MKYLITMKVCYDPLAYIHLKNVQTVMKITVVVDCFWHKQIIFPNPNIYTAEDLCFLFLIS